MNESEWFSPFLLMLIVGFAFGLFARMGDFCFARGLRQWFDKNHADHGFKPALRDYVLALAVAILATQGLYFFADLPLERANMARLSFSVPGVFCGGLLFGLGMTLARACAGRALVLAAGGNVRMWWALVWLGLAAQATMTGLLAAPRASLQGWARSEFAYALLPQWLQASGGVALGVGVVAVLGVALLVFALKNPENSSDYTGFARRKSQLCAAAIGLMVAAAWWLLAWASEQEFEPPPLTGLGFIAAIAEGWLFAQLAVGREAGGALGLGLGVLAGAFVVALATRSFKLEGFGRKLTQDGNQSEQDRSGMEMLRVAVGGVLMGFGGIVALGCTVGQGLSGGSTLSLMSVVALAGIVVGGWVSFHLLKIIQNGKTA